MGFTLRKELKAIVIEAEELAHIGEILEKIAQEDNKAKKDKSFPRLKIEYSNGLGLQSNNINEFIKHITSNIDKKIKEIYIYYFGYNTQLSINVDS